jgi:hypothetical protein
MNIYAKHSFKHTTTANQQQQIKLFIDVISILNSNSVMSTKQTKKKKKSKDP